jgi:ATP-dependent Clp protease adaptor protein ClpS
MCSQLIMAANTLQRKLLMPNINPEIKNKIKPNITLQEPPLFKIIYLNDDVTSMDFVVTSLVEYFNYNDDTATQITHDIHEKGSAVVAVLPYEIAEQKGIEVTLEARAQGYPLQVKVEAEKI